MSREMAILAYQEAVANLRGQKEDLRAARAQSAFSATVASIIASVFASLISEQNLTPLFQPPSFLGVHVFFWLVVFCFVASLTASTLVLTKTMTVQFEPCPIAPPYKALGASREVAALWELTEDYTSAFCGNEAVIKSARADLQLALIFGVVQICPWIILLRGVVTSG